MPNLAKPALIAKAEQVAAARLQRKNVVLGVLNGRLDDVDRLLRSLWFGRWARSIWRTGGPAELAMLSGEVEKLRATLPRVLRHVSACWGRLVHTADQVQRELAQRRELER